MPLNPVPTTSMTRPDLAAAFDEFDLEASRMGFVGLRVMPVFESNKQSAVFKRRSIESLLHEAETRRASGGDYKRGSWTFEEDNFATAEHGFEETVDDRESEIYADYFQAEVASAAQARDIVLRNHERRVAAKISAALFSGQTTAAGTVFSTTSSATPIAKVRDAKIAVRDRCGLIPNVGVIGWEGYQYLRDCAEIVDRVKYSGLVDVTKGKIGPRAIAEALDLDELLIAGGQRNTANENQTADLGEIWDRTLMTILPVCAPGAPLNTPCFGRTIHWAQDGSRIGGLMESYRPEGARYSVVRCRMETAEKEMYHEAVQVITGILS